MSEIIRKISLFGLGMIAITQEKLEEIANEIQSEKNREESKKFVRDFIGEKDKQVKDFGEKVNKKIGETLDRSGLATKKDVEQINSRLQTIEKKFNF